MDTFVEIVFKYIMFFSLDFLFIYQTKKNSMVPLSFTWNIKHTGSGHLWFKKKIYTKYFLASWQILFA